MNAEVQQYYLQQSALTDPGKFGDYFMDLPKDLSALKKMIQGLLLHFWDSKLVGYPIPYYRLPEIASRSVSNILKTLLALDPSSLLQLRPPGKRVICSCRDFAMLLCSILRTQKIPCRTRVVFSTYYVENVFHDQVVVEYWHGGSKTWRLVDPRVTPENMKKNRITRNFDLLNVPRNKLMVPGEAWKLIRSQPQLASEFCGGKIAVNRGGWYVRDRLVQDLALLNHQEMFLWDCWGLMFEDQNCLRDKVQIELLDELAELTINPNFDIAAIRKIYNHPLLKVPEVVTSKNPIFTRVDMI